MTLPERSSGRTCPERSRRKVFGNGGSSTTKETDYIGPFQYEDADGDGSGSTPEMLFFSHAEGRVRRAGEELVYETFLKDYLGNVRVMFTDLDEDGAVDPDPNNGEVLQVDGYYPFGLRLSGASSVPVPAVANSYLYNGKQLHDALGLGLYDYGFRWYDPAMSRFVSVDPLAEDFKHLTTYQYASNDPVRNIDLDGLEGLPAEQIGYGLYSTPSSSTYNGATDKTIQVQSQHPADEKYANSYFGKREAIATQGAEKDPGQISEPRTDHPQGREGGGLGMGFANMGREILFDFSSGVLMGKVAEGVQLASKLDEVATVTKEAAEGSTKTTEVAKYWPDNGGALGKSETQYLMPGTEIDRFGSGFGKYFSPINTPMPMRALPGGNTGAYSAYRVVKPFPVQSSTIAPAFGQPGLGTQFLSPVNANTLLKRGIIEPIK